MSADAFLDTNVFVYELDRTEPSKSETASRLIAEALAQDSGCISYQIIQECLSTFMRKAHIPISVADMRRYMHNVLIPMYRIPATVVLYERGLALHERYGFAIYDCLVVAAALEAGCRTLYTEDLQHGQQIEQLRIVNPFLVD